MAGPRSRSIELAEAARAFVADRDAEGTIPDEWYAEFAAAHNIRDIRTAQRHVLTAVQEKHGGRVHRPQKGTPRPGPRVGRPPADPAAALKVPLGRLEAAVRAADLRQQLQGVSLSAEDVAELQARLAGVTAIVADLGPAIEE